MAASSRVVRLARRETLFARLVDEILSEEGVEADVVKRLQAHRRK